MKIQRFEDLEAWQIARELTNHIYTITKKESICRDFGFIDQIRRAAISIMNNIAEGFERGTNKDFAKYIFIARGSAGEVRSMLYVALDQGYLTGATFQQCHELSIRCSQLCWGLIKHLKKYSNWKTKVLITIMTLVSPLLFLSQS
ncbi:MAG: four helix bundle protein [Syntrophobacterales bacterium]|jgi:four helix bundle protein